MNVYFLVEGRRTEMKVYPKWLFLLVPELERVKYVQDITTNNYYIFSGGGFPALLHNHLRNCISEINACDTFNYLVLCLDADEESIAARRQEVMDFIHNEKIIINPFTQFEIIVQNKCIETWFLGNRKIFKQNAERSLLRNCIAFYNVKEEYPELMNKPADFDASVSVFHSVYLQEILAERNIHYNKANPHVVTEQHFLEKIIERHHKTGHIASFKHFIDFCRQIRIKIQEQQPF